MKKIISLLLCALMLSACSNGANATVSDGNKEIITGGDKTYTKQDLFETLKLNDYTSIITLDLYSKIAKAEGIDVEKINETVDQSLADMKKQLGDQYETFLNYYGGEDMMKESIKAQNIVTELNNAYFNEHKQEILDIYKPLKAKIIFVEDKAQADKIHEEVSAGATLETAAANNGYTKAINEQIYTDKSDLALEVKQYLITATNKDLSPVIQTTLSQKDANGNQKTTDRFYIVQITNNDPESFIEEFYTTISKDYTAATILNSYFEKHEVEIYDQRTYDLLVATYEGLK